MAENRISTLFVMAILTGGVILGVSSYYGDFVGNYGVGTTDISYLNKTAQISEDVVDLKESIESTRITGIDPLDMLIAGAYNTVKLIFGIGDTYTTFITQIGSLIGIPGWATGIAIAAVMTVFVFGVISIVTKWRT